MLLSICYKTSYEWSNFKTIIRKIIYNNHTNEDTVKIQMKLQEWTKWIAIRKISTPEIFQFSNSISSRIHIRNPSIFTRIYITTKDKTKNVQSNLLFYLFFPFRKKKKRCSSSSMVMEYRRGEKRSTHSKVTRVNQWFFLSRYVRGEGAGAFYPGN